MIEKKAKHMKNCGVKYTIYHGFIYFYFLYHVLIMILFIELDIPKFTTLSPALDISLKPLPQESGNSVEEEAARTLRAIGDGK